MKEFLESLRSCSGEELNRQAARACRTVSGAEWELAALLLAMERNRVHHASDYSSMVRYAVVKLGIDQHKAFELLRVARALEHLPELSQAFRDGRLGWAKIRSVTRVARPDDEIQWLEYAIVTPCDEVEAEVVQRPRRWQREQGTSQQAGQKNGDGQLTLDAARSFPSESPPSPAESKPPVPTGGEVSANRDGTSLPDIRTSSNAPSEARKKPSAPPGARRILVSVEFTPEEYTEFEQLLRSRRSQMGRATKAQVLLSCMRSGTTSSRKGTNALTMVHVDSRTGEAWRDTERGRVPVAADTVTSGLATGPVVVVEGDREAAVGNGPASETPPTTPGAEAQQVLPLDLKGRGARRQRRPQLTLSLIVALFARASGRCENPNCRRLGPLHVDHIRPYSVCQVHEYDHLQLLCGACHALRHQKDFAERPDWRQARERSMRGRKVVRRTG